MLDSSINDSEVLYALALMRGRWNLEPGMMHYGNIAPEMVSFVGFWEGVLRTRLIKPSELGDLIVHLEQEKSYRNQNLLFEIEVGHLRPIYLTPAFKELSRQPFRNPLSQIVEELKELKHEYEEAKAQGIDVEANLLQLIGDSLGAQQVLLEILLRTQTIRSPLVAACWRMLERGVWQGYPQIEDLEEYTGRDKNTYWHYGAHDFLIDAFGEFSVQVKFVRDTCSCPAPEMDEAIEELVQRFYKAI